MATTTKARTNAEKRTASGSARKRQEAESDSGRSAATRTLARAAVGAGVTALGLAAAAAVKRARRPRVLGVRVPRELSPRTFDLKKAARRVGDVAERVERVSDDVRLASAQAKRASRKLT